MFTIYADAPTNFSYGFQDPASNWMLGITHLHDTVIFYLIILCVVVLWISISLLFNTDYLPNLAHGNLIELVWTITPSMILWVIGIPSLKLLYMMDEILDSEVTVKAIASQWFWTYQYSDYVTEENETISIDSFMLAPEDLNIGDFRQLAVDNYLVLPINTSIRVLCTSNDVIHSFAVPSIGIKADCLPGRLNSLGFIINRESVYYGGCSELCGSLHHAMPIGIKAVPLSSYLSFIQSVSE
jgi:cytochrome c oxidase subunit 2